MILLSDLFTSEVPAASPHGDAAGQRSPGDTVGMAHWDAVDAVELQVLRNWRSDICTSSPFACCGKCVGCPDLWKMTFLFHLLVVVVVVASI